MSLFAQTRPSLFGNTPAAAAAAASSSSSSPFGASQPGSLAAPGNNPDQSQKPTLGWFGNNAGNNSAAATASNTTNLFGSTIPQQAQAQATSTSLFGQPQPQQSSTSLFTLPQAQQAPGTLLFGQQQQQQQQPLQSNTTSLFGQPPQQQPSQPSLFAQSQPQAQQSVGVSLFGQTQSQQQNQAQTGPTQPGSMMGSSIWNPSASMAPLREKPVPAQMELLVHKWNSDSPDCVFQHYFYNQVDGNRASYYAAGAHEDAKKWEEALEKKPTANSIPVLARGPIQVGRRLEMQAFAVRGLQAQLHQVQDTLTKRMQAHELQYSLRAFEARRKHVVLARRTLSLAAKVQLLRNRGYSLDGKEEQLKAKFAHLEKLAFDPMTSGRQDEIWARLTVLRDRADLLNKESDDFAGQVNANASHHTGLDEQQIRRIEKILSHYQAQLEQLHKEQALAEKDLQEWLDAQPVSANR